MRKNEVSAKTPTILNIEKYNVKSSLLSKKCENLGGGWWCLK